VPRSASSCESAACLLTQRVAETTLRSAAQSSVDEQLNKPFQLRRTRLNVRMFCYNSSQWNCGDYALLRKTHLLSTRRWATLSPNRWRIRGRPQTSRCPRDWWRTRISIVILISRRLSNIAEIPARFGGRQWHAERHLQRGFSNKAMALCEDNPKPVNCGPSPHSLPVPSSFARLLRSSYCRDAIPIRVCRRQTWSHSVCRRHAKAPRAMEPSCTHAHPHGHATDPRELKRMGWCTNGQRQALDAQWRFARRLSPHTHSGIARLINVSSHATETPRGAQACA